MIGIEHFQTGPVIARKALQIEDQEALDDVVSAEFLL
jgi:hypothetical protein